MACFLPPTEPKVLTSCTDRCKVDCGVIKFTIYVRSYVFNCYLRKLEGYYSPRLIVCFVCLSAVSGSVHGTM